MKASILMLGAVALAGTPALASAAPANTSNGPDHMNAPAATTGQPGQDCAALIASNDGSTPGQSSSAPGSAFNPDGTAGSKYAGEQPQNSRNTASVSQYDVACLHGTR